MTAAWLCLNCYPDQTRNQFLLEAGPDHKQYEENRSGTALIGTLSRRDETILVRPRSEYTRVRRHVVKFILLAQSAMPLLLMPTFWLVSVAIRASCSQIQL
ncbi:hypothetical protein TNCV_4002581 [Trichonephila clavipes]|uniref:Uncharacterized protein n=1 Tax=Trichonephila clavipes TaxID=2585209 RepID=A0A8X6VA06_TRICX|nr:hypothetical protein TNCV_4002581 [Trichonephila clavipes]